MKKSTLIYIIMLLAVIAAAWYISRTRYQLLMINGDSMEPAYSSGTLVFIDRRPGELRAGDVALFRCEGLGCDLVKRVVALPGDSVHIDGGRLYVNAQIPDSPQGAAYIAEAGLAGTELTVPEGCCFVMGDDLAGSVDSRDARVGFVRLSDIIGRIID